MLYELLQHFLRGLELMGVTDEIDALLPYDRDQILRIRDWAELACGTTIFPEDHVDDGPCECEVCFGME